MNSFLIYLAQAGLYAGLMWAIYCLVWRNKPALTGSRAFLVSALILPPVLPLIRLSVSAQSPIAIRRIYLPEVLIGASVMPHHAAGWSMFLPLLYFTGAASLLLIYAVKLAGLVRRIRAGVGTRRSTHQLVTNTGMGPGTLWRTVFFSGSEVEPAILRHELAHIRAGHRFDTLLLQLMQVMFWFSPTHWLIGKELKMVHEFEADREALAGSEPEDYQHLLLAQSFGLTRPLPLTHSFFHHPLKRRMMMMQQSTARPRMNGLLAKTLLLSGCMIAGCLLIQCRRTDSTGPTVKSGQKEVKGSWYEDTILKDEQGRSYTTLNSTTRVYQQVDIAPQFDGNLNDFLVNTIHYPEAARAAGKQGRVAIQFVVDEHGQVSMPMVRKSSGSAELDQEALRVVSAMPRWKPASIGGAPVSFYFTLPISFTLGD